MLGIVLFENVKKFTLNVSASIMNISNHSKKKKKRVANIFNVTSSPDLSECFCFMPRFPILRPTLCPLTLLCPPPPLCPSLPLLQCFNFYFTCHLSVSTFPFCSCDLHQNNQYQSSYSPSHIGFCLHVDLIMKEMPHFIR